MSDQMPSNRSVGTALLALYVLTHRVDFTHLNSSITLKGYETSLFRLHKHPLNPLRFAFFPLLTLFLFFSFISNKTSPLRTSCANKRCWRTSRRVIQRWISQRQRLDRWVCGWLAGESQRRADAYEGLSYPSGSVVRFSFAVAGCICLPVDSRGRTVRERSARSSVCFTFSKLRNSRLVKNRCPGSKAEGKDARHLAEPGLSSYTLG